jgi:hypothetical protein
MRGGVLSSRPASAVTDGALEAALFAAAAAQLHALPSHACTALSAAAAHAQAPLPASDASAAAAAAPPAQALTAAQAALGAYFASCSSADAASVGCRIDGSLTTSTHDGAAPALDTDAYLRVAAALAAHHAREREALLTAQRLEVGAAAAALSRGFHALLVASLLEPLHATPCKLTAPTARPSTPHTPAFENEIRWSELLLRRYTCSRCLLHHHHHRMLACAPRTLVTWVCAI